ncbi:MAG: hypothetical protein AB1400_10435 [Pseudomonadota bacterium]
MLERALTAEFTPLLDTRHMAGSRTEFRLTCSLLAWQMRHSQIIAPLVDEEKVTSVSELQDDDSGILCRCRIEERPALACFDFFAEGCVLDMPLNPAISSWINRINRILPSRCLIFDVDSGELHLQAKYCFVDALSNHKTEAVAKEDDTAACRWVILTTLQDLQKVAKRHGANAVVDIVSYYKKNETRSDTTIRCHAGGFVAGAALKGTYGKVVP